MDPVVHDTLLTSTAPTMHAHSEDLHMTDDTETVVDLHDYVKDKHLSHASADSVATTHYDDDDHIHHRRSHSAADSLDSVITDATEPHKSLSKLPVKADPSLSLAGEQLDPWRSNSYDQNDLTNIRFKRSDSDEDDHITSQLHNSVTAFTTASTAAYQQTASAGPGPDVLAQLDREFELLTRGQPLQITTSTVADRSIVGYDFDREQLDDPRGVVSRSLTDHEKKIRMSRLFSRAASNGDMNRVAEMLDNYREWIDIEAQDEDGTTPLIYSACFGHTEIAFMLLEAGAQVDSRDKFGWTALVWATNNKHENIVRLLLEQGASTSSQTTRGHTIVDFLRHDPVDTTKIVQVFQEPGRRDSVSSNGSCSLFRTTLSSLGDDLFYQSGIEGFEEIMAENERRYRMAMDNASAYEVDMNDLSLAEQPQLDDEGEFDWERCLPDQMFVFSSQDIKHIINIAITNMEPERSRTYRPIPAYVLFLAARFAHYFSSSELLEDLLDAAISAIHSVTKNKPEDMTLTAYWISNMSVLLHFLRKDPGLREATDCQQFKIEAVLLDMVQMMILDAERRIDRILEPAMLDHDTIAGMEEVKFQSDWAFLWRSVGKGSNKSNANSASNSASNTISKRASSGLSPNPGSPATFGSSTPNSTSPSIKPRNLPRTSTSTTRPPSPRQRRISPRTITTMLSSLLFVMQTYDIHPDITHYVIGQLLSYVSCEVFNKMISNKKMLSRSKALQTRLNLSILEDWIRFNHLPTKLSDHFAPLVQLLQLLQVLSLQEDFCTWIETLKKLDMLNPIQVKRVVSAYRFEVNEPRLSDEITQYVLQVAADTERVVRQQMMDRKRERPLTIYSVVDTQTRTSGEAAADASIPATPSPASLTEAEKARAKQRQRNQESEATLLSETRNSKAWLKFKMPENMAERENGAERVFIPLIPDEMMSLLDTYSSH
ncbi:hypothetical protein B0O80DRAFT_455587 [Mortierella sp. GBAus27b]|nr:hypothetical protein B0O80DRAFT_455587 [Mortierella sp. GBAus27b]